MESVKFIKDFISLLADSVYNGLPLYLEDRIKTRGYQLLADNEVYATNKIRNIVEFAAITGMKPIPRNGHPDRKYLQQIKKPLCPIEMAVE